MDKATVWGERLSAWRSSDLSAAAFCRSRGLAYAQFVYWQRRLAGSEAAGLLPVRVEAPAMLSLDLVLPGGVAVRVVGASVADVVALVRGLSC